MIDPRELRVGNKLALKTGEIVEVEDIFGGYGINSVKGEPEYWKQDLFYIPLTEDWLEKLNFKKVQGGVFENISLSYWVNNTICCFYNETDKENFLLGHAYTDFNGKYHVATAYWTNEVHTLQNYYKANTRKELEVKS